MAAKNKGYDVCMSIIDINKKFKSYCSDFAVIDPAPSIFGGVSFKVDNTKVKIKYNMKDMFDFFVDGEFFVHKRDISYGPMLAFFIGVVEDKTGEKIVPKNPQCAFCNNFMTTEDGDFLICDKCWEQKIGNEDDVDQN